jgi:hypothetical protein
MTSIVGYAAAGLVAGLGIIWWLIRRMRQAEQADLANAGLQALNRGEIEASAVETSAEAAALAAKKRAESGW